MSGMQPDSCKWLTALPVYNERDHVADVLTEVRKYSRHVLVVDDGSNDGTDRLLAGMDGIDVVRHERNLGYGAALRTAFCFAKQQGYDVIVTIDCDGQHEPKRILDFVAACDQADIVSGSRYLEQFAGDAAPPVDRRRINMMLTEELNARLGLQLSGAFCGFKAYRVESLRKLQLLENGYGMPLELWVEACRAGLSIKELPVPLIYLDEERSFGGALDDSQERLRYYHQVLDRAFDRCAAERDWSICGESAG